MAKLHHTENGSPWLEITCGELAGYSGSERPICDECLKSLVGVDNIALVPILNEAFCPECAPKRLSGLRRYLGDRAVEERRTRFWLNYFGIGGTEP